MKEEKKRRGGKPRGKGRRGVNSKPQPFIRNTGRGIKNLLTNEQVDSRR